MAPHKTKNANPKMAFFQSERLPTALVECRSCTSGRCLVSSSYLKGKALRTVRPCRSLSQRKR